MFPCVDIPFVYKYTLYPRVLNFFSLKPVKNTESPNVLTSFSLLNKQHTGTSTVLKFGCNDFPYMVSGVLDQDYTGIIDNCI